MNIINLFLNLELIDVISLQLQYHILQNISSREETLAGISIVGLERQPAASGPLFQVAGDQPLSGSRGPQQFEMDGAM